MMIIEKYKIAWFLIACLTLISIILLNYIDALQSIFLKWHRIFFIIGLISSFLFLVSDERRDENRVVCFSYLSFIIYPIFLFNILLLFIDCIIPF